MSSARVPGLKPEEISIVESILSGIGEIWIFGSRATGSHKPFSDVDICVKSSAILPDHKMSELKHAFQESNLPFKVDLIDHYAISEDFRKLILKTAIRLV